MVNADVFFETSSKNRRISVGPNAQFNPKLNHIKEKRNKHHGISQNKLPDGTRMGNTDHKRFHCLAR